MALTRWLMGAHNILIWEVVKYWDLISWFSTVLSLCVIFQNSCPPFLPRIIFLLEEKKLYCQLVSEVQHVSSVSHMEGSFYHLSCYLYHTINEHGAFQSIKSPGSQSLEFKNAEKRQQKERDKQGKNLHYSVILIFERHDLNGMLAGWENFTMQCCTSLILNWCIMHTKQLCIQYQHTNATLVWHSNTECILTLRLSFNEMPVTCKVLQVNYLPTSVAFKSGLIFSNREGPLDLEKRLSWKRSVLRRDLKDADVQGAIQSKQSLKE